MLYMDSLEAAKAAIEKKTSRTALTWEEVDIDADWLTALRNAGIDTDVSYVARLTVAGSASALTLGYGSATVFDNSEAAAAGAVSQSYPPVIFNKCIANPTGDGKVYGSGFKFTF